MTDASQIIKCCFCSALDPARVYRTADGSTVVVEAYRESGPMLLEENFSPSWEVCESCGMLIDASDFDGLAIRTVQCMAAVGIQLREAVNDLLRRTCHELQAAGMVRIQ